MIDRRDTFAMVALLGLLIQNNGTRRPAELVGSAVNLADRLIQHLDKPTHNSRG